jgi:plastocyanin
MTLSRRACLKAGALSLASLAMPAEARAAATRQIVEIRMWGSQDGTKVGFDPVGILVESGQTVRWLLDSSVHTATAYHPANGKHSLRIPEAAAPWDSGYLVNPGEHFDVTLTAEGVYDYFCLPHEMAGMVGRIMVGRPTGPGALPFDYFLDNPEAAQWRPVPDAAAKAFPSIDQIMNQKIIRFPGAR